MLANRLASLRWPTPWQGHAIEWVTPVVVATVMVVIVVAG